MSNHNTNVSHSALFYLHNIRSIKKYLHEDSLHTLVHEFITNRFIYCNSLLYSASKEHIAKVQRIQNAAVGQLMNVAKHSHINPSLYELRWLPIQAHIKFKIILFTLKAIHNLAPSDINSLLTIKS